MKVKRIRDFLAGAVVASLVVGAVPTAFAKVSQLNIPVSYNNIKIVVDGKELKTDKEPFIYEGTTYLPVRAVAEAVGKNVSWDGTTNTVTLGSGAANTTPATASYSRTNPAPVGVAQKYTKNSSYSTSYTATIKVTDVIRGDAAWRKVKDANMFNDEAPSGKEYIVAKISAKVDSVKDDKSIDFSSYSFTPFSGTNVEYESVFAVAPEPALSGSVYEGGTLEGYVVYLVDKSDSNPKLVYGEDYDGTGGIWFSLTK